MPSKKRKNHKKKISGNLDDENKLTTCFICSVEEKWQDHKEKPEHKSKLKFFEDSFKDISEENVRCKLCKNLFSKLAFQKHASKKHKLIPWYRPENEFITFFKNNITNIGDGYRCHICEETHYFWYESIKHTEEISHSKIWQELTRLNDFKTSELTEKISQHYVTNGIILLSNTQLQCWTCDCVIVEYGNAGEHIISETHKNNLLKKKELMSETCSTVSSTVSVEEDHFPTYFENFIMKRHNDYFCNLCNKNDSLLCSVMNHIEDLKHIELLWLKRQSLNVGRTPCKPNICEVLVKNNIFQSNAQQLECYSCSFIISSYSILEDHINSQNHKINLGFISAINISLSSQINDTVLINENDDTMIDLMQFPESEEDYSKILDKFTREIEGGYYCYLCNIQFSTFSETMVHLNHQKHIDSMAVNEICQVIVNPTSPNYYPENVVCKLCNVNIPKNSVVEHAINNHRPIPWFKPDNEFFIYFKNFITPKNNYYCYICNKSNELWYLALEHVKDFKHSNCIKMFINDSDINQAALPLMHCKIYTNNSIFPFKFTQLRCWECNYIIDGYENAEKHISSDEHQKILKNISANEVPEEIVINDFHVIRQKSDFNNSTDNDEKSSICKIKSSNSMDQFNLSDSLEKNINVNESKVSTSSGYASTNTESAINYDNSDINTDLLSSALQDLSINKIIDEIILNENQNRVRAAVAIKQNNYVPDKKSLPELEDIYVKYFENCIFTWSNRYYCSLCQVCLFTEKMTSEHMEEPFHENQLDLRRKYISSGDGLPYLPNSYEKLVRNNIFYKNSSSLFCFSCQCDLGQYKNAEDHIEDKNHLFSFTNVITFTDGSFTENIDELIQPTLSPLPESKDHFVMYFNNFIEKHRDGYGCHICQIQFTNLFDVGAHINSINHVKFRNRTNKIAKQIEYALDFYELCVRNGIFQRYSNYLECFTCTFSVGINLVEAHIGIKKHKHKLLSLTSTFKTLSQSEITADNDPIFNDKVSEFISKDTSNDEVKNDLEELYLKCFKNYILVRYCDYFCNLCKTDLSTSSSVLSHIHGSDHQNLWMEERRNQVAVENKVLYIPNLIEILVRNNIFLVHNSTLKCVSCECIISGYICAEQHVNGYHHKANHATVLQKESESVSDLLLNSREDFATYLINFIEKRRIDFYCHLCSVDLSPSEVMTHVQDYNHRDLVKYKTLTSDFKSQYYLYLLEVCVRNSLFQVNSIELKCFKCQEFFKLTSCNIEEHVHSYEHKNKSQDDSTENSDGSTIATQLIGKDLYSRIFNISNESVPAEANDLISKCYNNYIYYHADDYFCNVCNLTLSSLQITAHLEYPDHQILLRQKKIGKKIMPMPACMSDVLEVFIRNNIFQVDSNLQFCFTCNCHVSFPEKHIATKEHKDNSECFTLKVFESSSISDNVRLNESENDYHQYFENFIYKDRLDYFCYACLKSLESSLLVNIHLNEETHKINIIQKKRDMNIMIDIPQMSHVYQKLVRNNIVAHESQNMKCYSCHYVLPSIMDVELHIESKFHQQKHGPVIIEPSGTQDTLLTDQSISGSSKVLNISQTNTKPLISLRASTVELKESRKTSRNVLTRDVFYYNDTKKSVLYCIVCSQKLESRVNLHVHLTSHFWQLFSNKNTRDLMDLTINSGVKMIVNNEESYVRSVLYDPMLEKRKTLLKYQSKMPNNDNSNKNDAVLQQLYVNPKDNEIYKDEISKGGLQDDNDLKFIDIDEDETPKKINIYAIDQELQYINQLSLNRICIINEDKIYCMICRKSIAYSVRIVYEHFRSIEHSFFLMQMIQDHIKFQGVPDELSDLSLARECIEDKNDRYAVCYVCDPINPRIIANFNHALKNHINQYKHLKNKFKLNSDLQQFKTDFHARLERSWSNTQRYWCVICSEQFKYEKTFYKHLNSKCHHKKYEKYIAYEDFVCDFCPPCGLLFYGFKNTLTYHSECKFHQYYADRPFYSITRLPTAVEDLLANAEKIIASKIAELDWAQSLMEHEEKSLIDDLKYTINHFMKAEIYPFGSRVSGLGFTNSDLDLFVDCDNLYYKGTIETDTSELLKEVEYALKQNEDIWTIKQTVLDCRIPIITITHQLTSIDCDLSFINGLSVESSKLIKSYIEKFPLCKQLILFVKDWINISNLGGEDGICSYAIAWMVIYYLQTKFILPNVATLIKAKGKSQLIGGWETGASTDFSIANSDYNFKDLLKGFFIMCAGFDYKNNIICPLLGRPVRKLDIVKPAKLTNLPDEMKLYKTFVTKNKKAQRFSLDSVMAVQDPYDFSNNLTKAVKKSTMYRFKTYCSLSNGKLAN